MALDLSPPPLAQLCCTQALAHVEKYLQTVRALTLTILAIPFDETTLAFIFFIHCKRSTSLLLLMISI
jgi:hypothetical protein